MKKRNGNSVLANPSEATRRRLPVPRRVAYQNSEWEEGGAEGIRRLLADGAPPTKVTARNEVAALGAIEALTNSGLEVPGDVSLVGFEAMSTDASTPVTW